MFEKATVTMPYSELKELLDKNKIYEQKLKELKEFKNIDEITDEEFEVNPFKKGLDKIFDLMGQASKQKKANEKQYFIYKSMEMYCDVFKIPKKELLEDIPKGKEPKNERGTIKI